jgi:hypothetical protein
MERTGIVLPFDLRQKGRRQKVAKNNVVSYLSREELLAGDQFRCHEINLGKGTLRIRELTAEEWLVMCSEERATADKAEQEKDVVGGLGEHFDRIARLVCKTAVDGDGKRLFDDGEEELVKNTLGAESLMNIYKQLAQVSPMQNAGAVGGPSAPSN